MHLKPQDPARKDVLEIAGRGDLHLGILLERMRREGYELAVKPPQIVMKHEGKKLLEPIESVRIECEEEHVQRIVDTLVMRKAVLLR